jgi:CDP-diacylglycerol--serine O-phosphatidyltransferase
VKTVEQRRAILPTALTLGNAVCGLAAISFTSKIGKADVLPEHDLFYLALGGWLIVCAMVFDALDGYVARLTRTSGLFGAELDSLCDAISFGAAPAFLLLQLGPGWQNPTWHRVLAAAATFYLVAAILRLARFNVENLSLAPTGGSKKFRGVPSPAAAGCVASLAIVRGVLPGNWPAFDTPVVRALIEYAAVFGPLLIGFLMVSPVPYPHLTKGLLGRRKGVPPLFILVLVCLLSVWLREFMLLLMFWVYVFVPLGLFIIFGRAKTVGEPVPAAGPAEEPQPQ